MSSPDKWFKCSGRGVLEIRNFKTGPPKPGHDLKFLL